MSESIDMCLINLVSFKDLCDTNVGRNFNLGSTTEWLLKQAGINDLIVGFKKQSKARIGIYRIPLISTPSWNTLGV